MSLIDSLQDNIRLWPIKQAMIKVFIQTNKSKQHKQSYKQVDIDIKLMNEWIH